MSNKSQEDKTTEEEQTRNISINDFQSPSAGATPLCIPLRIVFGAVGLLFCCFLVLIFYLLNESK